MIEGMLAEGKVDDPKHLYTAMGVIWRHFRPEIQQEIRRQKRPS